MNKLAIEGYHWNNRPRDVARLTEWASDELEKKMIWQVVDLKRDAEDWLDAPILYLAGHEPLTLDDSGAAKLKRFIDLGGMLITSADDGSEPFTQSLHDLMAKLYPHLRFRGLDPADDLREIVFHVEDAMGAQSLHNGVRHLALHIPRDISWTLHSSDAGDAGPWRLLANAYAYATEKGRGRNRLDSHVIARTDDGGEGGGPLINLGRARYDGNWDPEPLAWEIQSNFMHNEGAARLSVHPVPLDDLPDPEIVPLVHVAGTADVTFSSQQIGSIQSYVRRGGVLVFENAGGRGPFARSVMAMLAEAFPRQRLHPLSLRSPLITGEGIGGYGLGRVDYRPYAVLRMGDVEIPRLLAMSFDDQPRIFVSGEDLTHALLGQPAWGVFGYTPESARKIITNLALYAQSLPKTDR